MPAPDLGVADTTANRMDEVLLLVMLVLLLGKQMPNSGETEMLICGDGLGPCGMGDINLPPSSTARDGDCIQPDTCLERGPFPGEGGVSMAVPWQILKEHLDQHV